MTGERSWTVAHRRGGAADLHAPGVVDGDGRQVLVLDATRPAIVLGSTQQLDVVDEAGALAAGVDIVRRRSGGGAVWVGPGDPLWVDVVVPRDDQLWSADVGASFLPVGRAWLRALESVGVIGRGTDLSMHEGGLRRTQWSSLVCFAGTGPGEIVDGEAKVVGISQRRTRTAARFQCALYRRWDPTPLCELLMDGPPAAELATLGRGIGDAVSTHQMVDALVAALGDDDLT